MVYCGPRTCSNGHITSRQGDSCRLEERSIDHPAKSPGVLIDQPDTAANRQPGGTEERLRQGAGTGSKEYAVPRCGMDFSNKPRAFVIRKIFRHRSTEFAILADQHVRQA